jgi:putative transposase
VVVRSSKYLHNLMEQDHRRVKQRLRPMLGLQSFRTAAVVTGGIELAEKIKKGQFKIGKLGGRTATMPEIRQAALAAYRTHIQIDNAKLLSLLSTLKLHQSLAPAQHPPARD